jgi:hypothetical protein
LENAIQRWMILLMSPGFWVLPAGEMLTGIFYKKYRLTTEIGPLAASFENCGAPAHFMRIHITSLAEP